MAVQQWPGQEQGFVEPREQAEGQDDTAHPQGTWTGAGH